MKRSLAPLLAIVVGCGSGAPTSPAPSPIIASRTTESIRVTLTLEGPPRTAAASWASMTVENVGDRAIRWAGGGCGDPGGVFIDFARVVAAGRADWPEPLARFKREALGPAGTSGLLKLGYTAESRWQTNVACPAVLRIETIAPGQVLSMRAGWDGTYEGARAPTGPATVEAMFPVIGVAGVVPDTEFDSHPVGVSIPTQIVGESGAPVLSPALAIDAALADPDFANWVSTGGANRWINPDVARIGETWVIGLFKYRIGSTTDVVYRGVVVDPSGRVTGHKSG